MIYSQTNRSAPLAAAAGGISRLVRHAWHGYWDWRAKRMTVHILRSLDERTLRDIGISPGEICSVVYGGAGDRRRRYQERWRTCGGA
jgi:uncharacterized protein YjiS (DUF1127 family)